MADRSPMERLLCPRFIAIVGASATAGTFGATVLDNLDRANYAGQLSLINPKTRRYPRGSSLSRINR